MSFFTLDRPLGPTLVRRLYAVGAGLLALALVMGVAGGAMGCVAAMRTGAPGAVMPPLVSTVVLAVGVLVAALVWRVLCEYLLAVFRVQDAVLEIQRRG
jgi:hypothetical protein